MLDKGVADTGEGGREGGKNICHLYNEQVEGEPCPHGHGHLYQHGSSTVARCLIGEEFNQLRAQSKSKTKRARGRGAGGGRVLRAEVCVLRQRLKEQKHKLKKTHIQKKKDGHVRGPGSKYPKTWGSTYEVHTTEMPRAFLNDAPSSPYNDISYQHKSIFSCATGTECRSPD